MQMAPTTSGWSSPSLTLSSSEGQLQLPGSFDARTSNKEPTGVSPDPEFPWPATLQKKRQDHMRTMMSSQGAFSPMPTGKSRDQTWGADSRNYDQGHVTSRSGWSMGSPFSSSERDLMGDLRVPFETLFEEEYEEAWNAPRPLPDSPLKYRQHGRYYGKGTSILLTVGKDEEMGEGSGPRNLMDTERLAQARVLYDQM